MTCFAIALRRQVPEYLATLGVDDDHPVAEVDECGGETIPLDDCSFGIGSNLFEPRIERRGRALLAPERTQPNLPVI
jgi:hypothetical protein